MSTRHRLRAFTLIELLIVITIIGILAVALIPRIAGGPARARDAQRKTDLNQLAEALEFYANDNGGSYPSLSGGTFVCTNFVTAFSTYMTTVPSDPSGVGVSSGAKNCKTNYTYMPLSANGSSTPNGYLLLAKLENENISDDTAYVWSSTFQGSLSKTSNASTNLSVLTACDAGDCSVGAIYVIGR